MRAIFKQLNNHKNTSVYITIFSFHFVIYKNHVAYFFIRLMGHYYFSYLRNSFMQ